MLDPRFFRKDLLYTARLLLKRGVVLDVDKISFLEEERKKLQIEVQNLQNLRKVNSETIGKAVTNHQNCEEKIEKMHQLNFLLDEKNKQLAKIMEELENIYRITPNLPHETVPEGKNEEDNLEVRKWGKLPEFEFVPSDHVTLGQKLGMLNLEVAAKITGARFVVLSNSLAQLQRALINFMLDIHVQEHHYQELYVPHLVNEASLFGTGQLGKFNQDLFHLQAPYKYSLIPTAEVPVTNLVRDTVLDPEQLPLRFVAHTPCYRSEAGSYGKDVCGLIRQHQFEKVELVWITLPERSYQDHEILTQQAETILQRLKLPYRVVSLCGGDLGFSAAKTYDLEVWIPSQNRYREISSCSNFETFQARRMRARYRTESGNDFVHTLNGSGLAVGRTLVAILENYQDSKGNIHLPEALWPYMRGKKVISVA